jgi:N,N-dimethylformamidase beta subunit-like protein/concanavalin A-like lectin/glucanase superfamily protein
MPDRLLAYTDKLSVQPGDMVDVKVSSPRVGAYRASLVRLTCGDDSPGGPGYKTEPVASVPENKHPARHQPVPCGSYVHVHERNAFALSSFSIRAFVWPTWLDKGSEQCVLGNWDAATRTGYALYLDATGQLALRIGDRAPLVLPHDLMPRHWYLVAAAFDATNGRAIIASRRLKAYGHSPQQQTVEGQLAASSATNRFLIAAWNDTNKAAAHFNGKIDSPAIFGEALKPEALLALPGTRDEPPPERAVASWDFSQDIGGTSVADASHHRRSGRTVNLPTRAMTGWNWDGSEMDWKRKPELYGAIHFHEDDLYDCGWQTDFSLRLPNDLKSGIYCVRLVQDELEEFTPLFVRPATGKPTSSLAFLVPTASYLAYANHQMDTSWHFDELSSARFTSINRTDQFLEETYSLGLSTYDLHGDGSGVCHSSRLRPILNMRPKSDLWQFNADTHITDWLAARGLDCDIITDEDLERDGLDCLKPYRCVITGTHPEYYSLKMLDSVQAYTDNGGRLMYLGANGFYWRIAWHPSLEGVIEHRRSEDGMRAWMTQSGESFMACTGEYSGLWVRNGRAPNILVGAAFSGQGFDVASYYKRLPASRDPRAAFIFEGVTEDRIGDFGSIGGGAAGWELDRADVSLGTPPHALVLATADDFPASYHW